MCVCVCAYLVVSGCVWHWAKLSSQLVPNFVHFFVLSISCSEGGREEIRRKEGRKKGREGRRGGREGGRGGEKEGGREGG